MNPDQTVPNFGGGTVDPFVLQCSERFPAAGHALDLGCGPGRNSLWLAGRGHQVTAMDNHEPSLAALRTAGDAQYPGKIIIENANLRQVELPINTYDIVIGCYLWHYLPVVHAGRLLRAAYQALKPKGLLVVIGFGGTGLFRDSCGDRDRFWLDPGDADVFFPNNKPLDHFAGLVHTLARDGNDKPYHQTAYGFLLQR